MLLQFSKLDKEEKEEIVKYRTKCWKKVVDHPLKKNNLQLVLPLRSNDALFNNTIHPPLH